VGKIEFQCHFARFVTSQGLELGGKLEENQNGD